MAYAVKEIFYTLQGEGMQAGRAAVFVRFAGCNLWSGREADRGRAVCRFCDTDFVGTDGSGGGRFAGPRPLAQAAARAWQGGPSRPFVVLTGGEPLLQVDAALTDALRAEGFQIAVETNGTKPRPPGLDWVCVSPKASAPLVLDAGDELKLVYPQAEAPPERFEGLDFQHFLLQPLDGPDRAEATRACIEYCLTHPRWRLSVQMHKMVGVRLATKGPEHAMNARPRAPLSARSAGRLALAARSAGRLAPAARSAGRPARPPRSAAFAALALTLAAGACRRPNDEATGRAHGCTCSYLTDFDDNARIEVTVCVPASQPPLEVAATCASSLSRNYAESCTCGPPRESCSPSSADACRNQ